MEIQRTEGGRDQLKVELQDPRDRVVSAFARSKTHEKNYNNACKAQPDVVANLQESKSALLEAPKEITDLETTRCALLTEQGAHVSEASRIR